MHKTHLAVLAGVAHSLAHAADSPELPASPGFDQGAKWPLLFIALLVWVAGRTWKRWAARRAAARGAMGRY